MHTESQTPLSAHTIFQSTDLDEARERVAAVFCAHRLETIGRAKLDARHNHFAGERISLNYIQYGAKSLIAPGELEHFYLLQIPIEGGAAIANGSDRYYSSGQAAALLNPHLATTMIWEEGCRQALLWVDRRALQSFLSDYLGRRTVTPLTFAGPVNLTCGSGARLRQIVLNLIDEVDRGFPSIGHHGLLARQIESAVLAALLDLDNHNYANLLGVPANQLAPRQVRQAEEFMLAHLDAPVTLEDVARAAGVSGRALQQSFRQFRNMSPMAFLREQRLRKAHHDLQSAAPGTSVTNVALRWGFTHFGRFSLVYRQRYGCSPSETLASAKASGFGD